MTGRDPIAPGARVIIISPLHPCFDQIGHVIGFGGGLWVVELETWDPGRRVCAVATDLRRLP